jgi:hypothetical protein
MHAVDVDDRQDSLIAEAKESHGGDAVGDGAACDLQREPLPPPKRDDAVPGIEVASCARFEGRGNDV